MATLSDTSGELLLAADQEHVYNRLLQPLVGDLGPYDLFPGDVTQGDLIIPRPGAPELLDVFWLNSTYGNIPWPSAGHLVVDMTMDGGLGGVVPGSSYYFSDSLTEKLTGCLHANGQDYWILMHQRNDRFLAFLLTVSGLDTNAVISACGASHTYYPLFPAQYNAQGQMKVSVAGDRIALVNQNNLPNELPGTTPNIAQLFTFNSANGQVEYMCSFPGHCKTYGVEFSPGGTTLYISGMDSVVHYIDQYDLSAGDTSAVQASRARLYSFNHVGQFDPYQNRPTAMALGPDGKIYITRAYTGFQPLAVIEQPEASGVACDLQWNGLPITTGQTRFSHCNQIKRYHDSASTLSVPDAPQRPALLRTWPTPLSNAGWITGLALEGAVQLDWCNASGAHVRSERTNSTHGRIAIERGSLSPGLYVVSVSRPTTHLGQVRILVTD